MYTHSNGARYEGNWKGDLQDGYGVEIWEDQSRYEGYYKEGMKHGFGKYVWPDGSCYEGDWVDNKINGKVHSWTRNVGPIYMDRWARV